MNKYIVAYVSQFDTNLTQTLIEANSEVEAMLQYLAQVQDITFDETDTYDLSTVDAITETCFNFDSNISVFQL